jgi:hypothetical protein
VIRHIVLFSMKDETDGLLDELVGGLIALRSIPDVIDLSCSRNLASTDFDAALTVDLRDMEGLDNYRQHPDHAPVLVRLRALCRRIEVADIEFQ